MNKPAPFPPEHFALAEQALHLLLKHRARAPSLSELAQLLGVSAGHLQKVFSEGVGLSPKRFAQIYPRNLAIDALRQGSSALEATEIAGLSSVSRLHELTVRFEAMTPGEIAQGGLGLRLDRGVAETPLGWAQVASGPRGICYLSFCDTEVANWDQLELLYPKAHWRNSPQMAEQLALKLFGSDSKEGPIRVWARGTNFQLKVWEALVNTQTGDRLSYGELASRIGQPKASRAVGSAVANNWVALLIPCHRVIRETGETGQYRWGPLRKQALLALEAKDQLDSIG